MPNMDGIEAAKIIRVREATDGRPRTPILALTANARGEDYERCIAAGMDDYLDQAADARRAARRSRPLGRPPGGPGGTETRRWRGNRTADRGERTAGDRCHCE